MIPEPISPANLDALTRLMLALWPECNYRDEYENCRRILASEKESCFLIRIGDEYVAFIQLSLRYEYVEGTASSPVCYIEGLYVRPAFRQAGLGRQLVERGAQWGREKGCREYASDTALDNAASIAFHRKAGFSEARRLICFVKAL